MKKKILVLTLCFTLVFGSLNLKKSYADGGVISLPILATVTALGVGTGLVIKHTDDLYDLGRIFYDWVDAQKDLTWATVQAVFASSVGLIGNRVNVGSDFLDIVKSFFDSTFNDNYNSATFDSIPVMKDFNYDMALPIRNINKVDDILDFGKLKIEFLNNTFKVYYNNELAFPRADYVTSDNLTDLRIALCGYGSTSYPTLYIKGKKGGYLFNFLYQALTSLSYSSLGVVDFPYNGGYSWDSVDSNKDEKGDLPLPVPNDLGNLVGQNSKDFWDNSDNLASDKPLTYPNVDNPSIDVDSSTTFPNTNVDTDSSVGNPSVPSEGIWATIKDFIINLVVPSDTFWTDTWGGLYNNFTSSFPMVDMDGFNDLVTGEKKFPNIDINIMGVEGRVVNGDVINSIVDWLRPIVAGFMMLCLMLFNYRKIYKLIRNTEPFGGIAPGTSDFSTGISEYSKQDVVKATDMVAEYRAWKERGGK